MSRPDFQLLETLRYDPGEGFFLLEGHLERLVGSARYFGYAYDEARVREALRGAVERAGTGAQRVRLLLGRGGEVRVEAAPLGPPGPEPARVAVSAEPVDRGDPLLYHKTTHRELYRARAAAHPGCDDVLLVNERGEVTESTVANVVARVGGALWTPPLESGLLPGVFRAHLLRGGEIAERTLRPADLKGAEEVYLLNSVRKWRRAVLA